VGNEQPRIGGGEVKHAHVILTRRDAAQATLDRFGGKPFAWGRFDCAKMTAFHLRQMGLHKGLGLAKAGRYSSALTAKAALARAGHASLAAALDGIGLERIAPASALVGDILQLPGDGFDAMAIALGNGRCIAYHQDAEGAVVVQPVEVSAAWRVD